MAQLVQLRAALDQLASYELPDRYGDPAHVSVSPSSTSTTPPSRASDGEDDDGDGGDGGPRRAPSLGLDGAAAARYRSARERYLSGRIAEMLAEHVSTFDGTTFRFPPEVEVDEEEIRAEREGTVAAVERASRAVAEGHRALRAKYEAFDSRREELGRIVRDLEREGGRIVDFDDDADDDVDDEDDEDGMDVDEGEMAEQERRLGELVRRRAELEARLGGLRAEAEEARGERDRLRERTAPKRKKPPQAGGDENDDPQTAAGESRIESEKGPPSDKCDDDRDRCQDSAREESGDEGAVDASMDEGDDDMQKRLERLKAETEGARRRGAELTEMAEWYDSVRCAMEELSGIRVLRVEEVERQRRREEDIHGSEGGGDGDGATGGAMSRYGGEEELVVSVRLLGEFTLRVGLFRSAGGGGGGTTGAAGGGGRLRVSSASLEGDTQIVGADGVVTGRIPSMDDLVDLVGGNNLLPEGDDVRFVLREALARIRGVRGRVEDLVTLRKRYLAKIDGEGDEVVCTINDGVTVVLRLTADCTLLPGSAYIDQIAGVGGWDRNELEEAKRRVNSGMHRGAVEVMDAISDEVKSLATQPRTPSLPARQIR